MEEPVLPVSSGRTRKRSRNPNNWKRAKNKAVRYSPKNLPVYPTCNHEKGAYQCRKLTMTDIRKFFESFYAKKNKQYQDAFLLKYCKVSDTVRRRARVGQRVPNKYCTKLFVKTSGRLKLIPVCQKTFLKILHISVHRIRRVAKVFKTTGGAVRETRGGDQTSHKYATKKRSVKQFIESFKCLESHYCRSSVERKYLDSNLNIRKMWKMYCEKSGPEEQVKESYFRDVFNSYYNIGFGSPRTDVCSRCTELDEKIKSQKDVNLKNTLMIEKRVHNLKAKAFYQLLREEKEGMVTLSFDCQKNQVLPKVPDQIAYYSRQLYIYNFAIVKSQPDKKLNRDTVSLYYWTEDEFCKGANEICSAVYHRLNCLNLNGISTIRLVADGCGAQNKNSIMMGMCSTWLFNAPIHVKSIELVFPVPGHSFLPADRVFGNIERVLKKKEVITSPSEYVEIFDNFGTAIHFDMDLNWKSALHSVVKPPGSWHFPFAISKRFFIKRSSNNKITIKGEINYCSEMVAYKSVLKRGQTLRDVAPEPISKNKVKINQAKLEDVETLLKKHFGAEWQTRSELQYYKEVLASSRSAEDADTVDCDDICEPSPAEVGLQI